MTTTSSIDKDGKIRYAVVGLGAFTQSDALPAFAEAKNSELVALVSGDTTKRTELAQKYGVRQFFKLYFGRQGARVVGDRRFDRCSDYSCFGSLDRDR
jgi:hypothetical protein